MTPFQQLQVWVRQASIAQRAMAAIAAVITIALVGWLVTPVQSGSGSDAFQTVAGPTGAAASGGSAPTAGQQPNGTAAAPSDTASAPTAPGGTGGGAVTTGSGGGGTTVAGSATESTKQCPPTIDQGVTDSEIKLAVTIINIAGAAGNETIDVPTPDEQREDWQYVAESINAAGGAACRKLALSFYDVNPINPNDTQTKCLAMADSKPFLAIDSGSLTGGLGSADCIPQQKIPLVSTYLSADQLKKYYPFYISPGDIQDNVIRNGILGLKQSGYFDPAKGFKKLGVLFYSCQPTTPAAMRNALREAGITDNQMVVYDMGCPPGGQYSPADYQQAVLTFKNAGATQVTFAGNGGTFGDFTKAAGQQNFKPQYVLADSAMPSAAGTKSADPNNLDGAIDGVGGRYGEETTPGFQPGGGTAKCNGIFAAKGRPPVYKHRVGYGGVVCHYLWFVAALIDHAPQLQRNALVSGMHSIGTFDGSFPFGPIDFAAAPAGAAHGAGFWRFVQFFKSCTCWKVGDPTWRPPFP